RHGYRSASAGMGRSRVAPRHQGADRPRRLEHLLYLPRRLRKHLARAQYCDPRYRHESLVRLADRPGDGGAARVLVRGARSSGTAENLPRDAGPFLAEPGFRAGTADRNIGPGRDVSEAAEVSIEDVPAAAVDRLDRKSVV